MITGRGQNPQEGVAVVDWLRLAAPHARRIASICGGALLLAQTGLLDGRRATTHWKLLDTLQAEFPQVRVEGGPLYIQDEHIWTSGGVSSGFDLTLALVEEDYGFSLARDIAQDFVMYLRRPGGTSCSLAATTFSRPAPWAPLTICWRGCSQTSPPISAWINWRKGSP